MGHREEVARIAPDQQDRPVERGIASAASSEQLRAEAGHGRDEIAGHPRITPRRPEEGFGALVVQPARGPTAANPAPGGGDRNCSRTQDPCEPGSAAAHRRRLLAACGRELVVVVAVREDQAADPRQCRVIAAQREQEQSAGRVVGDHRGVFRAEQVEAVQQQPGQRRRRPVGPRGQRPGVRSERQVDGDAAVAVLERGDDVTPQVMIRERAGEEDERRSLAGRLPGQRCRAGFPAFRIP